MKIVSLATVKVVFNILIIFFLTGVDVKAQDNLDVVNNWRHFSDAPNSLYQHLSEEAYYFLGRRASKIAELNSISDWKQRQEEVRETLSDIIGPFPERTPLNPRTTNIIEKDGYRIEHIVYETQNEFYVPSVMFIPDDIIDKAPAIIYTVGHSSNEFYQAGGQPFILNLVKKGFIVFTFDPFGQGERLGYYDSEMKGSLIGGATSEHSHPGAQAFITGSSAARYMIWDGKRAVDYLITRDEVDCMRIGITGKSGGGTQAAYIAALDNRIYATAPINYITSLTRLFQTIGPQDAEQNLFHGVARQIDHADLLAVRAPKPSMMITTTGDFFSIQGARETAKEVSDMYQAYGKEDNFAMVEDDGGHVLTKKNREAIYRFFQMHLNNPGNSNDEEVDLLTDEEVRVTQTGQIVTSYGGETVFSLNRIEAKKLILNLQSSRQNLDSHIPKILKSAKEISGYQEPEKKEEYNPTFTGRIQRDGYVIEKYFINGEGDYIIPYLLAIPEISNGKKIIYLHASGKSAEASSGGEIEWFVNKGFTVLAPDMVGLGETGHTGPLRREWRASMLLGRSIVGIHAGDIVRLVRMLKIDSPPAKIYGFARKEMTSALLHAAAFDPLIARVALIEPYSSYRSIVSNQYYNSAFIPSSVPGALIGYDLPDLAASIAPRKLLIANITDGEGEYLNYDSMNDDQSIIYSAYGYNDIDKELNIILTESRDDLYGNLMKWIK